MSMPTPPCTCTAVCATRWPASAAQNLAVATSVSAGQARRQPPGRLPQREPDRLDVDVGVGQPLGDRLEAADRPAELHPLPRVRRRSAPARAPPRRAAARTARPCRGRPASAVISGRRGRPSSRSPAQPDAGQRRAAPRVAAGDLLRVMVTPASSGSTQEHRGPGRRLAGTRNSSASGARRARRSWRRSAASRPVGSLGGGRPARRVSPSSSATAAVEDQVAAAAGAAHRPCCSVVPNLAIAGAPSTIEARYGTGVTARPSSQHRALLEQAEPVAAHRLGQAAASRSALARPVQSAGRTGPGPPRSRGAAPRHLVGEDAPASDAEVLLLFGEREVHLVSPGDGQSERRPCR